MQLHHIFIRSAKRRGNKTAIIDRTTNTSITYSKALIGALVLAKKFRDFDSGFIGIMMPPSAGGVLSILGALFSGRIPVMINYSTGAAENAEMARRKCGFRKIVTSKAFIEKLGCDKIDDLIFLEDIMATVSVVDKIKAATISKLPERTILKTVHCGAADDPLIVLFTSGSEKEPKAVPLSHRNILSNIEGLSRLLDLSDEDRFLANLPYFHVFGQTANLWLPIYFGMTLIPYANPLDFKMICRIVREEAVTLMVGTPSFFRGYLQKSLPDDFKSIRIALVGADKCPDSLRREFLSKHDLPLCEAYGTTETSPGISVNSPKRNRPGSVGQVLPNLQVRIENLETGRDAMPEEIGKIMVKGDSVMSGYHDDPAETSLRLCNGWYDTGDMGYIDKDGYLWHAGRLRRFAKIGGEMVSLVKVENILETLLPKEVSCCVVEIPDDVKGSRIIAVTTAEIDTKRILSRMAQHLPNIALPRKFIVLSELPFSGSGKVDFQKVTEAVHTLASCKNFV